MLPCYKVRLDEQLIILGNNIHVVPESDYLKID